MNRYKALLSDSLLIGIGNFTTHLVYFFLMPIYTLAMTASDFGLADLLNNLVALLLPVFTLSISEGVFRFILDKKENPKVLLTSGLSIIVICAIVLLLIIAIIYLVRKEQYWIYFYFYFISEALKTLFAQFSRGSGYVFNFSLSGIIAALTLFGSTYILVKELSLGVEGYLWAFIIANSIAILYLLLSVKGIRTFTWSYSKAKHTEVLLYSLPLIPNTLFWWATNISSRYILAYECGLAIAGFFAATSKLPALVNVVTSVFQQSWQISSVQQSESSDYIAFYSKVFSLYSGAVFIFGSIILLFVPIISKFVLQGEFYQAWVYTPPLLFSAILGCLSVYFGNFYTVTKKSKSVMTTTMCGAIINIILCLVLIPLWGIYGALTASVASYFAIVIIRYFDTQRFMPVKIKKAIVSMSVSLLLFESICMSINSNMSFILSVGAAVGIFLLNGKSLMKEIKPKL